MAYKIGQKFKTRDGRIAEFVGFWTWHWSAEGRVGSVKENVQYPVVIRVGGEDYLYDELGQYDDGREHPLDLVAIVPAKKGRAT